MRRDNGGATCEGIALPPPPTPPHKGGGVPAEYAGWLRARLRHEGAPAAEAGDVTGAERRTAGCGRHARHADRGRPYFAGLGFELRRGIAAPITVRSSSSAA